MKRFVMISLVIILVYSFSFSCFAENEDMVPYASELTSNYVVNISNPGTTVTASARISGYNACDKIGYSSFRIQENRNGSWITVASSYNQYAYDVRSFSGTLTYTNAASNIQYRAICSFYISSGSSSDSFSITDYT